MGVLSTVVVLVAAVAVGRTAVLYGVEKQTMRRFLEDGENDGEDDDALAGCTIEEVGCFTDGCDGQECRSLQYGVDGCSGPGTTPAPTPSPTCDQPNLTNELCGQYCFEWLSELSTEIWAGTNNGECYCDTEYTPGGDENGQCKVECPEAPNGCDQPCAGDPSEQCGGQWFNQIVKVSCSGWWWAWPVVYGFSGMAIGYIVLGTALNMSMGKNEFPNAEFWRKLGGLVNDGMAYTMGHNSGAADPYKPIPTTEAFVPQQQFIPPQQQQQQTVLTGTPYAQAAVQPMGTAVVVAQSPSSGERKKKKKKVRSSSRGEERDESKSRRKKKDGEGGKEKKMRKKKKPEHPGPVSGME